MDTYELDSTILGLSVIFFRVLASVKSITLHRVSLIKVITGSPLALQARAIFDFTSHVTVYTNNIEVGLGQDIKTKRYGHS
jgi:hypothetical protein